MLPLAQWLAADLGDLVRDLLDPGAMARRGLFQPEYVAWMREAHASGRRNFADQLWALMVLELWFRIFMDGGRGWGAK